MYPNASPPVLHLLDRMLQFNPNNRVTAAEALDHPYLEQYSDPEDEPIMKQPFTFEMELDDLTADQLKHRIFEEATRFSTDSLKK